MSLLAYSRVIVIPIRCIARVKNISLIGQLIAVIALTVFVTKAYTGEKAIKYQLITMFTLIQYLSPTNSFLAARLGLPTFGDNNIFGGQ